ncbi:MAG TPA: hypothetical protein VHS96_16305, partial [Bacteroidia bacterium]|nr:hypothetical protein [Bacteroidia bacterium]
MLLLLTPFAGRQLQAQILYGSSPFQDSLWAIDTTNYSIISRLGPTLPGFTITGMNGLAYDPIGHDTYIIMKVSGVSGRVLGKIDLNTGVCTQVGNLGMNFSSITFNSAGQLFGVTGDGQNPDPETLFKINKNDGTSTLEIALGNGADGEVISYNHDDDMFYHWSGNGTVVFEKFPATAPYTPVTNIPTIGTPGGETFGSLYLGNGTFMISNISSNFRHLSTNGTYGAVLTNNPDDLRGPVMPPQFSFAFDTVCVADTVTWNMVNASFAKDTAIYHWGDGTSTTVFPAGPATHAYAAGGNFTTYAILKNDSVGEDTISSAVLRVNALPAVALNPATDTILCFTDTLAMLGASGGSLQWYLNGAPIVGANGASLVITTSGWYNQEKINQNGCRDSAATGVLVAFGDQPVADLGADSTLCDGDSLCIGLNNPSNVTYLWSTGSTLNAECFNISGTYEVTASDSVGCVETDIIMVEFMLAPDLNVVVDTSNCPTVVFSANDPNGTSWSWAFGDGDTGSGSTVTH